MESQQQRIERIAQNGYNFDMGACINEGWALFRRNPGPFVIYAIIVLAISAGLGLIPIIGQVAAFLIGPALTAGYYIGARKLDTADTLEVGDFFKSFDFLLQLFLSALVGGILMIFGFVLLVLPGIWLAVGLIFLYQMVIFAKVDFWEAIKLSIKVINKNWFSFFGFAIVLFLINLLGLIALVVGLLISIPVTYLSIYAAYKQVIGFEDGGDRNIADHLVDDRI